MRRGDFYGKLTLYFLLLFLTQAKVFPQGTQIDFSSIPKSGTILINSHMDDDLIWMLPFWEKTDKFICGAMPQTPGYRTIINQQQAYMNNNNYNIQYEANWYTPWDDVSNTEYVRYYLEADPLYNYLLDDHLETRLYYNLTPLSRYEINKLKAKLEQYFADSTMSRAVTHNNWGEYGHLHHIGLNQAVRELAVKYRRDVWMLGCDNGAFIDVNVPDGITYTYANFNTPGLYTAIRTIYTNNGFWTWSASTVPSGSHKFIKIVDGGNDRSYVLKGDEITYPGANQLKPGSYIFDGNDDFLTLKGNNNSSFTIMMKVQPDMLRAMDIASMAEYPFSTTYDRNIYLTSDGHVSASIFDGTENTVTSTSVLSTGRWNHIAITSNGSQFKLYVNGMLDKTIEAGAGITDYLTPEFILGLATKTSSCFSGQIYDVRLLNNVLNDTQIASASGMVFTITSTAGTGGTITPSGSTNISILNNLTYNIVPSTGYHISDVTVDNVSVGAVSSYTFTSVMSNHTISATFAPSASYIIKASAGTGGSIDPAGDVTVYDGTSQTFNITPGIGYRITDVLVDSISAGRIASYTFSGITGNHTISVTFEVTPTHIITASAGPNGNISPSDTVTVNEASNQTFTITPSTGYKVTDVTVDGAPVGPVTTYTFTDIMTDHTITASFEIMTYSLISSSGQGGLVSPDGELILNHGSTQTYSFHPMTGYRISSVIIDNVSVGTPAEYTFTNISANHSISVTFTLLTYTISATVQGGGTITPRGNILVTYGSSQTFNVSAYEGYYLSDLLVNNISVGAVSSYTFNNITSNQSITAEFTPITYTVTATAGSGGSITPSGDVTVVHGSNRIFNFIPDFGFQIDDVKLDNVSLGAISSYTLTNVTTDHTISVSFATATYIIESTSGTGGTISPSGIETVTHGSSRTFTITPSTGYRISDVRLDNTSIGAVGSYTLDNITTSHLITAVFELIPFTISVIAGTGGSINPSGNTTITYGSSCTFSIVPGTGYSVADVFIDDVSIGPVNTYTFSNVTANHSIRATFDILRYTITANAGQGGIVSPSGVSNVMYGSQLTVNITPNTGYRVSEVRIDNAPAGAITTYTFANITSSHTLTASFEIIKFNITGTAGNGGTINPEGSTSVNYGTNQTYSILPSEGYNVSSVIVDGSPAGQLTTYTFSNITSNHSISASFSIKKYTITIDATAGGTVNPDVDIEINHGSDLTYYFTPDSGYMVSDIKIDGISKGSLNEFNFENISDNHSVEALFRLIPTYIINASAGNGGTINPAGDITLTEGSDMNYIISPDPGYRILGVTVDNKSEGILTEYLFQGISSDHSIKAEFTTSVEASAYPNPFRDEIRIFIASPDNLTFDLSVVDTGGRLLFKEDDVPGNTEIPLRLTGPDGMLFIRIYKDSKKIKIIKVIHHN